jgi:hypothetical protein
MTRRATRLVSCTGAAVLTVAVGAATAQGQATTGKFQTETAVTDTTALPECWSYQVGNETLINTTQGTFAATDTGFHIEGSEVESYRVDFPDGSYVTGVAVNRFSFNAAPSGETTFTTATREPRTIYGAAGEPIGTVFIHALSHITYRDANANGVPDSGEITSAVDQFFFTCG